MYLPAHKFYIDSIGTVTASKNGQHKYIEIILRKPAQRDEFDEAKYPDDYFQCTVWNDKINQLPEIENGDKVEAVLNYQGRKMLDQNTGDTYYTKQFNIQKLTKL